MNASFKFERQLAQRHRGTERELWSAGLALLLCASVPLCAFSATDDAQRAKDAIVVKALLRLPGVDLNSKPEAKAALLRHLETIRGSEQWLEIIEKFKLRESKEELLRLAIENADTSIGVRAAGLL